MDTRAPFTYLFASYEFARPDKIPWCPSEGAALRTEEADNCGGFPIDQGTVTERPSFIVGIREPLYAAQIHAPLLVTVTTLCTTLRDTVVPFFLLFLFFCFLLIPTNCKPRHSDHARLIDPEYRSFKRISNSSFLSSILIDTTDLK